MQYAPPARSRHYQQVAIAQVLCLAAASGALLLLDGTVALSFLLGGLICTLPNMYFALRLFRRRGPGAALAAARSAYAAAAGKFALSALGFAAVFALLRPIVPVAVFAGYGLMWVAQLVCLVWVVRRR